VIKFFAYQTSTGVVHVKRYFSDADTKFRKEMGVKVVEHFLATGWPEAVKIAEEKFKKESSDETN